MKQKSNRTRLKKGEVDPRLIPALNIYATIVAKQFLEAERLKKVKKQLSPELSRIKCRIREKEEGLKKFLISVDKSVSVVTLLQEVEKRQNDITELKQLLYKMVPR